MRRMPYARRPASTTQPIAEPFEYGDSGSSWRWDPDMQGQPEHRSMTVDDSLPKRKPIGFAPPVERHVEQEWEGNPS